MATLVLIAAVPVLVVVRVALVSVIVAIALGIVGMHVFSFLFLGFRNGGNVPSLKLDQGTRRHSRQP
jgi:hypothetical protein